MPQSLWWGFCKWSLQETENVHQWAAEWKLERLCSQVAVSSLWNVWNAGIFNFRGLAVFSLSLSGSLFFCFYKRGVRYPVGFEKKRIQDFFLFFCFLFSKFFTASYDSSSCANLLGPQIEIKFSQMSGFLVEQFWKLKARVRGFWEPLLYTVPAAAFHQDFIRSR